MIDPVHADFEQQMNAIKTVNKDASVGKKGKHQRRVKHEKRKRTKTKFEEFLEMEKLNMAISAEEDLLLERRLAKQLKVKEGLLRGPSDGLTDLLDGVDSSLGVVKGVRHGALCPKAKPLRKRRKNVNDLDLLLSAKAHKCNSEAMQKDPAETFCLSEDDSKDGDQSDVVSTRGGEGSDVFEKEGQGLSDEEMEQSTDLMALQWDKAEEPLVQSEENDGSPVKGNNDVGTTKLASKSVAKYVAPHLRSSLGHGSSETVQLQRHVRGLLNRLSEANVESIASEFSVVFQAHGRRVVSEVVSNEILGASCGGPRGNDQYAAVFAAFVAGLASLVGMYFGAKFVASLAVCFEEQYKEEDSLALRNLTLLLSYLYNFKLLASDLIYELLSLLYKRMKELDVATILTILQSCGMSLRGDDPVAMKDFVLGVQRHVQELKTSLGDTQGGGLLLGGKRMQYLLEMICEIKNNKRRPKEESAPHLRLKKWLQKLRVEEVQLRAISWAKLLDPSKKGQWWLSGASDEQGEDHAIGVADFMDREVAEAEKLLQLASSQRMNTEIRRAVFCIIMSGEDYLDAFEKILRLKLTGKQDRDVLRVVIECCLQEKIFNKYYSLLAAKLCHHDKNHKFTLQYCLWDHFKQLGSMEMRRIVNLARLLAELIGTYALSLSVLKALDFSNSKMMTPKVVLCLRIFLKALLTGFSEDVTWNVFSRIAAPSELQSLRDGLSVFLHQQMRNSVNADNLYSTDDNVILAQRRQLAKKALLNTSGLLLK